MFEGLQNRLPACAWAVCARRVQSESSRSRIVKFLILKNGSDFATGATSNAPAQCLKAHQKGAIYHETVSANVSCGHSPCCCRNERSQCGPKAEPATESGALSIG